MSGRKDKEETGELCVAVDTREQRPYRFPRFEVKTLASGDYSIVGLEDRVAIERKQPQELFHCVGQDRERFIREMERLAELEYAAIVIEGDLGTLLEPSLFSKVSPKAVLNSLLSWSVQYGVHVYFAGSRSFARALTYRLLEKFWKYRRSPDV